VNHTLISSDIKFSGHVFDVKIDKISLNQKETFREVVIHHGGAVVLPLTEQGKVVLVNQYRYPLEKRVLELPAGKLNLNEDPQFCAVRELKEETGYTAGHIEKLGSIYTSPGFCTEELHIYLANNLKSGEHNREDGELDMYLVELSIDEIIELIKNGEIKDAKTLSGIFFYINKFLK